MVQGEAISSIFESKTEQSIGTTGSTVKTSTTVKKVGKTVPDLELQLGDSASGLSSSRTRHDLSGHSDDSLVAASHTAELIREKSDSGRANATNVTATNVSTSVSSCPAPMLGSGMKLPSKWLSLNFGSTEETKIESVHTSQGGPLVHNYTKQ